MKPLYFLSPTEFRQWLERHHRDASELHVGFYRKDFGPSGLTYSEAVDEALCFGWIDGLVQKIDESRFTRRFTPRKISSIWSNINVGHVERLLKSGRMRPAGVAMFEARSVKKTGIYSFEQKNPRPLPPACLKKFKAHTQAWAFFSAQAPSYQRLIVHKIVTARREATRDRWLERAITASASGQRL